MGIETVQNIKKKDNIGRRPNAERQNAKIGGGMFMIPGTIFISKVGFV